MAKYLKWPQIWPGFFFPTNPDLADILGRTDLDFESFHFWILWIPNFQMFRFQISKFPEIWPGPGRAIKIAAVLLKEYQANQVHLLWTTCCNCERAAAARGPDYFVTHVSPHNLLST